MSQYRFFTPYVGDKYHDGIMGKKVLVVGASFYCAKHDCPFFTQCTSTEQKNSSSYNAICTHYADKGTTLSDEPTNCVTDGTKTYYPFVDYMGKFVGSDDYDEIWAHMAFTNYVQFFLPVEQGETFRETRSSDLSERDFRACMETLQELQPDIVIVWGTVINSALKECNPYLVDKKELQETESYVCHLDVPGVNHPITLINPYHPSSSAWYSGKAKFDCFFNNLLNK